MRRIQQKMAHALPGWLTIIVLLFNSPISLAEMPDWVKTGLKIEHPGKITVEYLGQIQASPPRYQVKVADKLFTLFDDVKGPDFHTAQLIEWSEVRPHEDVLEIGTGSGAIAVFAAPNAQHVLATDISAAALANSEYNIKQFGLSEKIELLHSDLFKAIPAGAKFDVIYFNIIYPYNADTLHHWTLHERFFREVGVYLKPTGRIYYQAGFIENIPKVHQMVGANKLRIAAMHMVNVPKYQREPIVFVIEHKPTSH